MRYALFAALIILWELALFDTYTHCLTAEGFLQGWLGVMFHAVVIAITGLAGMWFRDHQRS